MTVLLQVSDPHFGTEDASVVVALERLTTELRPDVLLLSGDITQRATRAQFAAARAFVDRLGVPACVAIPGNHDIPLFDVVARSLRPYARYAAAFGDDLEPRFENGDALVLGVNTTRWYRHQDGAVSAAQIERVATQLSSATRTQWRIVVVHQPLAVTLTKDLKNLARGHEAALRRWREAGADLVVGGHIHLPYVLQLPGPAQTNGKAEPRTLWVAQAGTAISRRVRPEAGNSVNVIRVEATPRRAVIERWDHDAAARRFARVGSHALASAIAPTDAAKDEGVGS
ncbi:metallophosphoesterase [uncultured Methylibium sp.]|uniref:metallophosphoesterase family protein n=1 Tax=uncultured Methylibium sp. TaxID=381093 RepID=UPI0025E01F17|nr:metallophosphoesterase [uncultured Methylibium sp.]